MTLSVANQVVETVLQQESGELKQHSGEGTLQLVTQEYIHSEFIESCCML